MSPPGQALAVLVIGATLLFGFGFAVAVYQRARLDHRRTKEALPGLRKDKWRTLGLAIKAGFWIGVGVFVLIAWTIAEGKK